MENDKYKIIFPNDVEFFIDRCSIELSSTLVKLFTDETKINDFKENKIQNMPYKESIKMDNVDPQIFSHIETYMSYIRISQKEKGDFIEKLISNMNCNTLMDVICLADYLDIKGLVQIAGDYFKSIVLDKTPEEARKILGIEAQFTDMDFEHMEDNLGWKDL